jgi:mycothiol-dependent nitroreductase-like protein
MSAERTRVDLYADPCCPFAWIAYRWLVEMSRHRGIDLRLHLMSLAILNQSRDITDGYWRLLEHTWAPVRVAAATQQQHGYPALVALYRALGRRIFVTGQDHYPVIRQHLPQVIGEALAEFGLPGDLANAASVTTFDSILKASHDAGMAPVGDGVGTPVIHLCGNAFFGPVMTAVPDQTDAVRVFDGLRLLAGFHDLFEIRRPLVPPLSYGMPATYGRNSSTGGSDGS